jgi:2-phosphosulfolactate phosphatase
MTAKKNNLPHLHTVLTPQLLDLYEIQDSIVVIIDVFRATSTMATALYNGARKIIPVDSPELCIEMGKQTGGVTAGERDGKLFQDYLVEILHPNIHAPLLKIKL